MFDTKGAAKYLGYSEASIKWHLFRSEDTLLSFVAIRTGEGGEGHRHTKILFTRDGLDWFKRNVRKRGEDKPAGWVDELIETDPPPELPTISS
jgi:hypothetical protein